MRTSSTIKNEKNRENIPFCYMYTHATNGARSEKSLSWITLKTVSWYEEFMYVCEHAKTKLRNAMSCQGHCVQVDESAT